MKPQLDYTLYLVTDQKLMSTPTLEEAVEAACEGGVTLVQIREKSASDDAFLDVAQRCKAITDAFGAGLIINDNPQVAAAVGAAGFYSWLVTDIVLGFSQGFGVVLTLPALIGTWGVHLAMPLGWAAAWILLNLSYYVIYRSRCGQMQ